MNFGENFYNFTSDQFMYLLMAGLVVVIFITAVKRAYLAMIVTAFAFGVAGFVMMSPEYVFKLTGNFVRTVFGG